MKQLGLIFFFSFRNLKRRPRRTWLLILGLALVNILAILIPTFRYNTNRVIMENLLGMKFGKEQLMSPGHLDLKNKRLNPRATFSQGLIQEKIQNLPVTFRLQSLVMLASDSASTPMILTGYNIKDELKHSRLGSILNEDFTFKHSYPLIVGKRLALKLDLKEGDEVGVIAQAIDGSLANENFKIEKVVDLGGGAFESSYAVTTTEALREFLTIPQDQVHTMVNFSDANLAPQANQLGLKHVPWQDFLPDIASGSRFMNNFTRFYSLFFVLMGAMAAGAALALSFLERTHEYRMLATLGTKSGWLRLTMVTETFLITLAALIIGNLVSIIMFTIFQIFPLKFSILTGGHAVQLGGLTLPDDIKMFMKPSLFLETNTLFVVSLFLISSFPVKLIIKRIYKSA